MLSPLGFQSNVERIKDGNVKERLTDLEASMRRSNISSQFQKRSRERVVQRQYLKRKWLKNFQNI